MRAVNKRERKKKTGIQMDVANKLSVMSFLLSLAVRHQVALIDVTMTHKTASQSECTSLTSVVL